MTRSRQLLIVTEEERRKILESYEKTEEEFQEDVKRLREWVEKNPHLPLEAIGDQKLAVSLLNGKMSLERAKQGIEAYFRIRALHADFFERLLPNTEEFDRGKNYIIHVAMPKLAPDLTRIIITRFTDLEGEAENGLAYYLSTFMMAEIRFEHDFFIANTIIVDLLDYNMKIFLKFTPAINQKLVSILNVLKLRFGKVHIINAPPFLDKMLLVFRSILPDKLFSKINVHPDYESLHKEIPKEYLPSDYGGTEKSLQELHEEWYQELKDSEPHFQKMIKAKSKEEFKVNRDDEAIFGMGSDGTFKKLVID